MVVLVPFTFKMEMENTVREALTNVKVMEQNYSEGAEILLKQRGMKISLNKATL